MIKHILFTLILELSIFNPLLDLLFLGNIFRMLLLGNASVILMIGLYYKGYRIKIYNRIFFAIMLLGVARFELMKIFVAKIIEKIKYHFG